MAANTPNSRPGSSPNIPMATPIEMVPEFDGDIPMAMPVTIDPETDVPMALPIVPPALPPALPTSTPFATKQAVNCPVCGSARQGEMLCCDDCGYHFTEADIAGSGGDAIQATALAVPAVPLLPGGRLQDRYEATERLRERAGVTRFKGLDHGTTPPTPVLIVRQLQPPEDVPVAIGEDEILPTFDMDLTGNSDPNATANDTLPGTIALWPGVLWESLVHNELDHPALPRKLDQFAHEGYDYLVLEQPTGTVLWDVWDDPELTWDRKFGTLVKIAEAIDYLHGKRLIFEALRPDLWLIDEQGHPHLTDTGELVSLPLPQDAPILGRLYTAPEVLSLNARADVRADLFGFGAMLYALHVGREPTERDFVRQGEPKPFIPQFPDVHPAFGRLMSRTFRRELPARFPSDEAGRTDPTGWQELIHTLKALQRTYDTVRLEIASWTTTGMVRTGNEDGFALIHATEARQDDLGEQALVLLCDGMGGYEAGETAAALAIQVLRKELLQHPAFAAVAGRSPFPIDPLDPVPEGGYAPLPMDLEAVKAAIKAALKEATRIIYAAAKAPGSKRMGMGCTAEVVFLDGRQLVVGHVGDSRTYHLREGRLIQITRDQTYVNRMVELGQLTEKEAETHPRRNELQQALGGRPDVEPGLYTSTLHPGDWIVVCSDGVTNHVRASDLQQMLQSEASSADMCARRLVNLTNIEGATDNATVVVIRCT